MQVFTIVMCWFGWRMWWNEIDLKQQEHLSHIPVIFLTARTETEDLVKAFDIGGADYITKPFNHSELLARVHLQLILKEKKDELSEASNKNKQLVRILLHDLRNPIAAIKSINDMAEKDPNIYSEMNHLMIKATENCLNILESVRKMYSIDDQKYIPEMTYVNLENIIKSTFFIFQNKLREKGIKVEINISSNLKVFVDGNSFVHSVLSNLITNAIKFSFPNSSIAVDAYQKEKQVILSIKDFGMGMPKEILENIFDIGKSISRVGLD